MAEFKVKRMSTGDIELSDNDYLVYTVLKELTEAIKELAGVMRGK